MAVTKVVMPKLSEAMDTGRIIKWLKKEGDPVSGGDIVAEIETDKADVEMEAFGAGVLRKILVPAGERAPVGTLIAVIAEPGEDISSVVAGAAAPGPGGGSFAQKPHSLGEPPPGPGAAAPAAPTPGMADRPAAVPPQPRSEDPAARKPAPAAGPTAPATGAPAPETFGRRLFLDRAGWRRWRRALEGRRSGSRSSPLAKKIAAQSGVDLRVVHGSGPGGRIIRRDVEAALTSGPAVAPARVAPSGHRARVRGPPLTPIRAVIAKRMPLSKAPVPHFYVTSEVAMDRAWALREELNGLEGQPKISVNDLVIRACALALLEHPGVNASFQGEAIRVWHRAHIGVAVALDEGLITPVLRDCQEKSLSQIAVEARDLVERARTRKLRAQELSGATFSISNLGMFDVADFSAIINPPEGGNTRCGHGPQDAGGGG